MKRFFFLVTVLLNLFPLVGNAQNDYPRLNELISKQSQEERVIESYLKEIRKEIHQEEAINISISPKANKLRETNNNKLITNSKTDSQNYIRQIFNQLKPVDNKLVRFFVQYYTTVGRAFLNRAFKRMETYFPVVKKYAETLGLPLEVAVFGIIESGYTPKALSHKGARGIWQLMPLTAKIYGLKINSIIDERMDIEKSTEASFKFIKSLSEMFNKNWEMVLAGYNGGGGYISTQIRKYRENNFWKLCQKSGFKSETLEFVPRFYAVLYVLKNAEKYGLKAPDLRKEKEFENIVVNKNVRFKTISKYTGIPVNLLNEHNPHLMQNVVLKNSQLYVPKDMRRMVGSKIRKMAHYRYLAAKYKRNLQRRRYRSRKTFRIVKYRVKRRDSLRKIARRFRTSVRRILKYNRKQIRNPKRLFRGMVIRVPLKIKKKNYVASRTRRRQKRRYSRRKRRSTVVYRVRRGDTLFRIARRYGVSVRLLKRKNRLRSHVIRRGQRIRIPLVKRSRRTKKSVIAYRIRQGDTLYALAKKFNTSVYRIARKNDINHKRKLFVGQTLLIPQGGI